MGLKIIEKIEKKDYSDISLKCLTGDNKLLDLCIVQGDKILPINQDVIKNLVSELEINVRTKPFELRGY